MSATGGDEVARPRSLGAPDHGDRAAGEGCPLARGHRARAGTRAAELRRCGAGRRLRDRGGDGVRRGRGGAPDRPRRGAAHRRRGGRFPRLRSAAQHRSPVDRRRGRAAGRASPVHRDVEAAGATSRTTAATSPGPIWTSPGIRARGSRGRALLPPRPVPADLELTPRYPGGQPPRHLEHRRPSRLELQLHHQHQPPDELLGGGVHRAPRTTRAAVPADARARRSGEQTARRYYAASGSVVHHNTSLWRFSTPVSGDPQWANWPSGLLWLSAHLGPPRPGRTTRSPRRPLCRFSGRRRDSHWTC